MTVTEPVSERRLPYLVEWRGARCLVHPAEVSIQRLVYSTASWCSWGDDLVLSNAPVFEVRAVPPGAHVVIEQIDINEDGRIEFTLEEIEWADGVSQRVDRAFEWQEWPASSPPESLEAALDRTRVATRPGAIFDEHGRSRPLGASASSTSDPDTDPPAAAQPTE